MICKHVDVVAVAILLFGMALFSHARRAVSITGPHGRITIEQPYRPEITLPKPPRITFALD